MVGMIRWGEDLGKKGRGRDPGRSSLLLWELA